MIGCHQISGVPEYDGGYLEVTAAGAGTEEVEHGIKGVPVGLIWWEIDAATSGLNVAIDTTLTDDQNIHVIFSAAATVRIIPLLA